MFDYAKSYPQPDLTQVCYNKSRNAKSHQCIDDLLRAGERIRTAMLSQAIVC